MKIVYKHNNVQKKVIIISNAREPPEKKIKSLHVIGTEIKGCA